MGNEKDFDFHTYLVSHAEELKQFSKDVNILTSSALTQLQRLPVSLRRRAASHNIKRLPFRFRKTANIVAAKKIKRKCRYYIRRHLNLHEVYLKRQLKNKWLYTHIWHAKRFKLVNKWGWRIPYEPAQKTFRPCTKAMQNGCSLIDVSYFSMLEFHGKTNKTINKLVELTGQQECSKIVKSRIKEGKQVSCVLYRQNSWPYGAICPCRIVRVSSDEAKSESSFFLSFHPSARDEVFAAINQVFQFQEITNNCWISDANKIVLRDRSAEFCRFRLLGHLSQIVVKGLVDDSSPCYPLLTNQLNEIPREYVIETEIENLKSKMPALKQTDIPGFHSYQQIIVPPRQWAQSAFQSKPEILDAIKSGNKTGLDDLLKFNLDPIREGDKCPMIMTRIHYLDSKAPGGWELVVPARWCMSMWMTLVMKGCRPMGLRYWARFCALEASSLLAKNDCFPLFGWPDTNQGVLEEASLKETQSGKWKRRPPSKRINFSLFATESPFGCPWRSILPPSDDANHQFYVMRDINVLFRVITPILEGKVKPTLSDLDEFNIDAKWALIPVVLECFGKAANSNAVIMVANIDDSNDSKSTLEQPLESKNDLIRPIIGYTQLADQSLVVGKGCGFGFISLYQLVSYCHSHQPCSRHVWIKNTNTRTFVAGKLGLAI